jgi:Flp pilus assembly protein TadG
MIRNLLTRLGSDRRGTAVIELSLVAPVLALLVVGIVDMSNAFSRKLALEQGAQRAVEKIMQTTGTDTVENTLKGEVQCQVNGTDAAGACLTTPVALSDVTVTFRLDCTDADGTVTTQTNTDPTAFDALVCANDTDSKSRYIQVEVDNSYSPMFPIHFFGINADNTYHLSAVAGMRTE